MIHLLHRFIKKLTADHILMTIFFAFLMVGLFLGDGKQPLIDTLASVVIISMYIFVKYYVTKKRDLSKTLTILWGINLLYFIVRTIFSDSVGYSITTTMRFVMAYLIFNLFYQYSDERYIKYFKRGLVIFSMIAVLFSFFFILFPQYSTIMPLMNLLYANYGHNNLANILVMVYPIALLQFLRQKDSRRDRKEIIQLLLTTSYLFLVTISLFLSFSRAALFLVGLYTIFQLGLLHPKKFQKRLLIVLVIGILSIASFLLFSQLTTHNQQPSSLPQSWLNRQLYKPLLTNEGRLQYGKQAIMAIKDHPLFGTGPGTFYLDSKRYQEKPNEYSWFAHNFILEELSEIGIVGTIPLLLLIGILLFPAIKQYNELTIGIFLVFLNSFFDFNLDFLIIWLLLWSTLGLVSNSYET